MADERLWGQVLLVSVPNDLLRGEALSFRALGESRCEVEVGAAVAESRLRSRRRVQSTAHSCMETQVKGTQRMAPVSAGGVASAGGGFRDRTWSFAWRSWTSDRTPRPGDRIGPVEALPASTYRTQGSRRLVETSPKLGSTFSSAMFGRLDLSRSGQR
jgi:hypothetical protein